MTLSASSGLPTALAEQSITLDVSHLDVTYRVRGTPRQALRDVSFQIGRQESFGLVGESGCGKSTTALAITRYLPRNGSLSGGSITVNGQNVASMDKRALRQFRARMVSMVYQEPGRALNPSIRVGRQVAEVYEIAGMKRPDALARAEEMLRVVQIADPGRVLGSLPASALRRHAAAGHDRHGPCLRALAADPRRTNDGTRCHRRGRGP